MEYKIHGEKEDNNDSYGVEESYINEAAKEYKQSLQSNLSNAIHILKKQYNIEHIIKALNFKDDRQLLKTIDEKLKAYLEQHSLRFNSKEQRDIIVKHKIRQIVDEVYATKIIEIITKEPIKMPHS